MGGIGVGEVMSWLELANKIKELIQECNGRSKHLAEFTKFLSTVQHLLGEVHAQTSGLPECADLLDDSRKRIAEAITDCERWAQTHKFWNAHSEKKDAEAKREQIRDAVVLLQAGMSVFALKKAEADARCLVDELRIEAFLDGSRSQFGALGFDASLSRQKRNAARGQQHKDYEAVLRIAKGFAVAAQRERSKLHELTSDMMLQHRSEQLAQHTVTQGLVKAGLSENSDLHGETHVMLRNLLDALRQSGLRLDGYFQRVAEEGGEARKVASEIILEDLRLNLETCAHGVDVSVDVAWLEHQPPDVSEQLDGVLRQAGVALVGLTTDRHLLYQRPPRVVQHSKGAEASEVGSRMPSEGGDPANTATPMEEDTRKASVRGTDAGAQFADASSTFLSGTAAAGAACCYVDCRALQVCGHGHSAGEGAPAPPEAFADWPSRREFSAGSNTDALGFIFSNNHSASARDGETQYTAEAKVTCSVCVHEGVVCIKVQHLWAQVAAPRDMWIITRLAVQLALSGAPLQGDGVELPTRVFVEPALRESVEASRTVPLNMPRGCDWSATGTASVPGLTFEGTVGNQPAPSLGLAMLVTKGEQVVVCALESEADAISSHYDWGSMALWRDGDRSAVVLQDEQLCKLQMRRAAGAEARKVAVRTLSMCGRPGRLALVVQVALHAKKLTRVEGTPITVDPRNQEPVLRGWDRVVFE